MNGALDDVLAKASQTFRRLWALNSFAYSIRVFIALAVLTGVCGATGEMPHLVPLLLGAVACALAETDDNWRGRLQALLLTLACFGAAAVAVQWAFPHPIVFACGLVGATFCLTMLGAISRRYQAIAYGTLILIIYTAIGMDQRGGAAGSFWLEPALLLTGATWYGLLSVLWCALFLHQPVQQTLARLFHELDLYLRLKSTLFEPVRGTSGSPLQVRRIQLAQRSGEVVIALNAAKESIFNRVDATRESSRMKHYLHLYFIAQDIHERASSSHYPYDELIDAFFHSDVLFRCQRLLRVQGRACGELARAILLRLPYDKGRDSSEALEDLQASLALLEAERRPAWAALLGSLGALARNLAILDEQLARAGAPDEASDTNDGALFDRAPHSWTDAAGRVRDLLHTGSTVFRHALRLSLALAVGFGLLHVVHARQGYWILLTTVFVCQPSFGATRKRMLQRIAGTFFGLAIGWALFELFPSLLLQSMFAVVAGVVFFSTRTTRYALATAAMTLVVLMCFNQVGDGTVLIAPRLLDTLIGSLIAIAAVVLVLPDWQGRRLDAMAARTLAALAAYLRELVRQYRDGRNDNLPYRLARRNAHNADAALSGALTNLLQEPGQRSEEGERGLRFLVHSHTVLNYLSGLGAHRQSLGVADPRAAVLLEEANGIADSLDAIGRGVDQKEEVPSTTVDAQVPDPIAVADEVPAPMALRLMDGQLRQLKSQLPSLSIAFRALHRTA